MIKLTFIDPKGHRHEVESAGGTSLMEAAVFNNVPGVLAECGGSCACGTCHCYVAEAWLDKLPPVGDMEDGMLYGVSDRRAGSRLICQIPVTDQLDGLELEVAG